MAGLQQMGDKKVVSSGNSEIDDKMGGGVPIGSLTLIEGHSSAGKSVLAQQMMCGSLNDLFTVSAFTTENGVASLIKQMESLNLGVLDFLLLNKFRILPIRASQLEGGSMGFSVLLGAIEREDSDLVFVDSLTSLIVHAPDDRVLSYFERCKSLCSSGMTIIFVVHSHALNDSLLVRLRSLCDAHLALRTEEIGDRMVKTLEVSKVRGAEKSTGNIISFDIEPGWGMRIIPLTRAQA